MENSFMLQLTLNMMMMMLLLLSLLGHHTMIESNNETNNDRNIGSIKMSENHIRLFCGIESYIERSC